MLHNHHISREALPANLQKVFDSRVDLEAFRQYASQNFCEESLMFIEEVLHMKTTRSATAFEAIVSKYIRPDSPLQVRIEAGIRDEILHRYNAGKGKGGTPDLAIFDAAFHQVTASLESDTLPRWKRLSAEAESSSRPSSRFSFSSFTHSEKNKAPTIHVPDGNTNGDHQGWFRGTLNRRKGFFGIWKPLVYMRKGNFLFEFKAGSNHLKATPLSVINLEGSLVESARTITGKDFTFILHTREGKSYFLQAAHREEMHDWMDALSGNKTLPSPMSKRSKENASMLSFGSGEKPPSNVDKPVYQEIQISCEEDLYKAMPILNFLESFTDAIVVSDSAGMVVAINSAAEKMFGFTKQEIKGESLKALMPEPYRSLHDAYMFRHEKFGDEKLIGKTRNIVAVRKSGEVFNIQISLGKLPVKGYFIATIRERFSLV